MSQTIQFILEKRIMTKKPNKPASTRGQAQQTKKARKGHQNGTVSPADQVITFDLTPATINMIFAVTDAERKSALVDLVGEQLFDALEAKDLASFQQCYMQLSEFGVDIEEYRRPLPNPADPTQTFMACVTSAALYHFAMELLEQQFRFGIFTGELLFRRTSGSPLMILASLARIIADDPETDQIPSYLDVCDRCIKFMYETIFNTRPEDLDPQTGIITGLKLVPNYEAIESFVEKHQNFYYGQWLAGMAPNPPHPDANPLMSIDPLRERPERPDHSDIPITH